jgi:hypothetical protein
VKSVAGREWTSLLYWREVETPSQIAGAHPFVAVQEVRRIGVFGQVAVQELTAGDGGKPSSHISPFEEREAHGMRTKSSSWFLASLKVAANCEMLVV